MVGGLVDMTLMRHAGLREGRVECRPSRRNAGVEFGVLRVDRRLDLRGILGAGLDAIEWNRSSEIRAHLHGKLIDDASAKAEADGAQLAGAAGPRLQPPRRGKEVRLHLHAVDLVER